MSTVTISNKNLIKRDLVVVSKKDFERMTRENNELRLAIKAILSGESALRYGETRSLKSFLKSRAHGYAKDK